VRASQLREQDIEKTEDANADQRLAGCPAEGMIPFQRILLPTDYSPACEKIIPWVKDITGRLSSTQLSLVHAFHGKTDHSNSISPEEQQIFEDQKLRAWASKFLPLQHVECFAEAGEPGTVINQTIEQQACDLVMMPTHGWGPLRKLLLGSVTAKILHDSSAAVWTAGPAVARQAPPYRSIVCALDETEEAEAVLRAASWLAQQYNASLATLHVVTLPLTTPELDYVLCEKELVASANARMRELKSNLGISAPYRVTGGMVATTIREEAVRRNADLIVTGRGLAQGGLTRIWSSLYEIVREAPCAVLSL
jgi:nucleotide-binding universal stress UspA family protein